MSNALASLETNIIRGSYSHSARKRADFIDFVSRVHTIEETECISITRSHTTVRRLHCRRIDGTRVSTKAYRHRLSYHPLDLRLYGCTPAQAVSLSRQPSRVRHVHCVPATPRGQTKKILSPRPMLRSAHRTAARVHAGFASSCCRSACCALQPYMKCAHYGVV